ncbi:small integral membrane protein 23 [Monodelphis domestica]|uniref:small integral membrane protein 23 n=1 Tax=Monodelphis domestica TaxID=13616 RepID=UPI0004435B8E|nr:small integral membrane protein 23 [Monodelphis domestica]
MQVGQEGIIWKRKAVLSRRVGAASVEKKQSILILLILSLYVAMWISEKSADSTKGIQECNYSRSHEASKSFDDQFKNQPKEPVRAMGLWLRENLDTLQERMEQEVRALEQRVKDLEEWLDYHLRDLGPDEKCVTLTNHL